MNDLGHRDYREQYSLDPNQKQMMIYNAYPSKISKECEAYLAVGEVGNHVRKIHLKDPS